jgi:hypothetical protein
MGQEILYQYKYKLPQQDKDRFFKAVATNKVGAVFNMYVLVDEHKVVTSKTTQIHILRVVIDNAEGKQVFSISKHIGETQSFAPFSRFALNYLIEISPNDGKKRVRLDAFNFLYAASLSYRVILSRQIQLSGNTEEVQNKISEALFVEFLMFPLSLTQAECRQGLRQRLAKTIARVENSCHECILGQYDTFLEIACDLRTPTHGYKFPPYTTTLARFGIIYGGTRVFYTKNTESKFQNAMTAWRKWSNEANTANIALKTARKDLAKRQSLLTAQETELARVSSAVDAALPGQDTGPLREALDSAASELSITRTSLKISEHGVAHASTKAERTEFRANRDVLRKEVAALELEVGRRQKALEEVLSAIELNARKTMLSENIQKTKDQLTEQQKVVGKKESDAKEYSGVKPQPTRPQLLVRTQVAQMFTGLAMVAPYGGYIARQVLPKSTRKQIVASIEANIPDSVIDFATQHERPIRIGTVAVSSLVICADPLIDRPKALKQTIASVAFMATENAFSGLPSCALQVLSSAVVTGVSYGIFGGGLYAGLAAGVISGGIGLLACAVPDRENVHYIPSMTLSLTGAISMYYGFGFAPSVANAVLANQFVMSILSTDAAQRSLPTSMLAPQEIESLPTPTLTGELPI